MMKTLCLIIFMLCNLQIGVAQNFYSTNLRKPSVDTSVFGKWPVVGFQAVSGDGKYALYYAYNYPAGSHTAVVESIDRGWSFRSIGAGTAAFTDDSRKLIFIKSKDSLCYLTLGGTDPHLIATVTNFELTNINGKETLIYHTKCSGSQLVFHDMASGNEMFFENVLSYSLSNCRRSMLLQTRSKDDKVVTQLVKFFDWKSSSIWEGKNASQFVFDQTGDQIAFLVEDDLRLKSVWYFKSGFEKSKKLPSELSGVDSNLTIEYITRGFNRDGSRLYVSLKATDSFSFKPQAGVLVDVWSYSDPKLQSQQLMETGPRSYAGVIDINNSKLIRLQHEHELIQIYNDIDGGDMITVTEYLGDPTEQYWYNVSRPRHYLVAKEIDKRFRIEMSPKLHGIIGISPNGKFILGTEVESGNFLSYDITTHKIVNLTKELPIPYTEESFDELRKPRRRLIFAGWLEDKESMLFYDDYDIWQVNLSGNEIPINITNGYGRTHDIVFQIGGDYTRKAIKANETLILSSYNIKNKNAGFFRKTLNQKGNPEKMTMGPYTYTDAFSLMQQKAKYVNVFVVRRESSKDSPNYFWTSDFKRFNAITDIYPEKAFNWLTAELLNWTTLDGISAQGVLYKPEDFDPRKKYPIIFSIYEKKSDQLNVFKRPGFSEDEINIPWFVSRGYLVFTPDIHYKVGYPGQSAFNSIISAAKYLSKFKWVDTTKMGLQGHSFGAFETNYLVAHTNLFSAAVSACGVSNLISEYGSLWGENYGISKQAFVEAGQLRMGTNVWEAPDMYIKNSPLFSAHKVTTPMLLMNNKNDRAVGFAQGVEFFTALRRLGKRVWMLQYDGENHSLNSEKAKADFTLRMTQFFDHYLKNAPAPKWMLDGVPASFKGIKDELNLIEEKEGNGKWKTPGDGLFTPEEKRRIKLLDKRKPLTVTLD